MKTAITVKIALILLISVVTLLVSIGESAVAEKHALLCKQGEYSIVSGESGQLVKLTNSQSLYRIGAPNMPFRSVKYILPDGVHPSGIRVLSYGQRRLEGTFLIEACRNLRLDQELTEAPSQDPKVYSSTELYPSNFLSLGGVGSLRGHTIAEVIFTPFQYIPKERTLYVTDSVTFEFVTDKGAVAKSRPTREDPVTLRTIRGIAANGEGLPRSIDMPRTATSTTSTADSVPCVIITNQAMKPVFDDYAVWKTKCGTSTEVQTVEYIEANYSGNTSADQIRNFIRDCYLTKQAEWVILGGDVGIIPGIHVRTINNDVLTDQYYACLDYNTWDQNGNGLPGETEYLGDTVDYYPEVYVGRLPVSDSTQARAVVDKLLRYQGDTTITDYQLTTEFTSSKLIYDNDGIQLDTCLSAPLPVSFSKVSHYNALPTDVLSSLNAGRGLVVNNSHAQYWGNFLTLCCYGVSGNRYVHWNDIDSLQNDGRFGVFFNYTCYNNMLDSVPALGRNYMLNPHGGGVGYLGSTYFEWSLVLDGFHQEIFSRIFDSCETHVGKAVADAKLNLTPLVSWVDNIYRYAAFSNMYLGDPQMELWTDTPRVLSVVAPDTLITGQRDVQIRVFSDGAPVANAKVCLWSPTVLFEAYEIGFTDDTGYVSFTVPFVFTGDVSIVASKHNYFPFEHTLTIKAPEDPGGGGGCPKLYVWDGRNLGFCNNLLAHSEDVSIADSRDDAYPVYWAPVVDGTVQMKILEDEQECSWFNELRAYTVQYSPETRLVLTDKGEFRVLGGDALPPVSAMLNGEKDITELVAKQDAQAFVSSAPGFMVLKYVRSGEADSKSHPGTSLESDDGGLPIDPEPKLPGGKLATTGSDIVSKNIVSIYALDDGGDWALVNTIYPRFKKTEFYTELGEFFIDTVLTVKLEWSGSLSLDYLPFEWFSSQVLTPEEAKLQLANHSVYGDVSGRLSTPTGDAVTLKPGESIDIAFSVQPSEPGQYVGLLLIANGRYETFQRDDVNSPVVFDQNYPNPFNPSTTFSFSLSAAADVSIIVYNVLGQQVKVVTDQRYDVGRHQVVWDGKDGNGHDVATGVYLAKLKTADTEATRKVLLLR